MKKRNGFTLVELLAVIVILAVVMLIGATTFGPIISGVQKSALRTEWLGVVDAGKIAYQYMQSMGTITGNKDACYDLEYLYEKGHFEKGSPDDYEGSILVNNNDGNYTYTFWITNGTYAFEKIVSPDYNTNGANEATDYDNSKNYRNCGGDATGANVEYFPAADVPSVPSVPGEYVVAAVATDVFTPSRRLDVYYDGTVISVKQIAKMNGEILGSVENPGDLINANIFIIQNETELKITLNDGTVVVASLEFRNA